jgi:hypothetical protein
MERLLLLCLLACACDGPTITYGERSVVIRPRHAPAPAGEGGAAGVPLAGASGGNGAAGDVAIDMPAGGGTSTDSPVMDAGTDASIDTADAGEIELPPSFCPRVSEELLDPGLAGDGSFSGCAPKICSGFVGADNNAALWSFITTGSKPLLASEYEGCTRVDGNLAINFVGDTDLEALSCLERVDGSLIILNTAQLENLDGLSGLLHVAGDLRIARLDTTFADATSLTEIDALANLRTVGGSLVMRAPYVTTLSGLQSLRAIGRDFFIDQPVELGDLSGVRSLRAIGGDLRIAATYRFTSIYGLDALETIGGSLELSGNAAIPVFHEALPKVTCVGGQITIKEPNLWHEQLDLLPALERVGGAVTIQGHPWLRTITMLKNVAYIGGALEVRNNESLEQLDLGSLQALDGFLWVTHNPRLEECPLIELADSIGAGAMSEIHDNSRLFDTGCRMALRSP